MISSCFGSASAPPREVGQHDYEQDCNHNHDQRHLEKIIRIQDHRRNSVSTLSLLPARPPVCAHLYLGSVATPERCATIISCFSAFTQVAFSGAVPYPEQSDRRNEKAHQVLLGWYRAERLESLACTKQSSWATLSRSCRQMPVTHMHDQAPLAYHSIWIIPSDFALSRSRCSSTNRYDGSHVPAQTGILFIQLDSDRISYVA